MQSREVRLHPRNCAYSDKKDYLTHHLHKAISRSDFSSRQALSSSFTKPRSDGQSPPSTPQVDSFAETYDRYRERSGNDTSATKSGTRRDESLADRGDTFGGGSRTRSTNDGDDEEDEDDFRSAISEARTPTPRSRRSTVGGRVLNSPLPGRRTPRKLARRSVGGDGEAGEWGATEGSSIAEQEVGEEAEVEGGAV
jgi:hypothetical protein